jgi:hypothetical protein
VGYQAGLTDQGVKAIAIGASAGFSVQSNNTVAIGQKAGMEGQNNVSVAIGYQAGCIAQGTECVALGDTAGCSNQGGDAVAIGNQAGRCNQGSSAVAIGALAGQGVQGTESVGVGYYAGKNTQGDYAVAVGSSAGQTSQGTQAVAIGYLSGQTDQGQTSVAIGNSAGQTDQGSESTAIGDTAGQISQGNQAVAIGEAAGQSNQGGSAIAMGVNAGRTSQGTHAAALGNQAGETSQGNYAVAVGFKSGETSQGTNAVAVGYTAGQTRQGNGGVGVGTQAGQSNQGTNAVAVGNQAGRAGQGSYCVAVGFEAGETNQHDNTIVLNAFGNEVNTGGTSRFYVKPIRSTASGSTVLSYNDSTGEIIDSTNLATDSTRISAGTGIRFNGETSESFDGGGGSGTATRVYHMRFNNGRQLTLTWTDDSQFEFKWGGGGNHVTRASIGNSERFGFTFTGQHRNFIKDVPYQDVIDRQLGGLIVCANNNEYVKISGGIEKGSNAITQNEALPILSLSSKTLDKSCFGVISESEDPNSNRGGTLGMFKSYYDTEDGDKRVIINSLGEGAIWVTNANGSLESGDYITTSNVAGYGQKQDSEFLTNYTVAKITMDCDFEPTTNPVQIIRKEVSNVTYWVNTTYENVTNDEYIHLDEENRRTITETVYTNEDGETFTEQNEQSTYTEVTRTIYQQITIEESKTEREGWSTEIRQETNNILDEHGQIQWEDHPTETEKAYKIRYLDANGNITNESNYVYKAAYVGCTYHCG